MKTCSTRSKCGDQYLCDNRETNDKRKYLMKFHLIALKRVEEIDDKQGTKNTPTNSAKTTTQIKSTRTI